MSKTISFIRLDFLTVKPYLSLKNFLIFAAVALVMIMSSGASVSAIAILMVYTSLYISIPFTVSEKSGIDALYITLSIRRNTVVLGRYLFALIVDVAAGLLSLVYTFAVMTILRKDIDMIESLVVTLVMLLLYSLVQAVQLPMYFKLGYAKAKFLSYLPFIGLAFFTIIVTNFLQSSFSLPQILEPFQWLTARPLVAVLLISVIWLGIMVLSYQMSCTFYKKRDF